MSTMKDRLGEQAMEVTRDVQKMGGIARDAAQEKLGHMCEQASGYYRQKRDKVQGVLCAFEQSIGQRPLRSVLIAAGAGLMLGRFWSWMRR